MKEALMYVFVFLGGASFSQTISPFVIGGGADGINGNMHLCWTFGETFGTTISNSGYTITQGFHQPLFVVNDSVPFSDSGSFIPNGITVNNDGMNDSWVIDGVDTLNCTIFIFNRWGDLIWKGEGYNNTTVVWEGDNQSGGPLPPATYFYVIRSEKLNRNGWIELLK